MSKRVGWNYGSNRNVGWWLVAIAAFCVVRWSDLVCRSCGKVKYVSAAPTYGPGAPESYRTEEEVLIVYTGGVELRVVGCRSGNRYIFFPGATRRIDTNDAGCLLQLKGFVSA